MNTNIDYWEKVLKNPSPAYSDLFEKEKEFLISNIPQNSRVLDIGCGEGRNIRNILNVTDNVVGIDNDPIAIEDAKEVLADIPSVEVVLGSAFELPFEDEAFDIVTLMMTLVNFGDRKPDALKEMKRVIKKDGAIIISVYSENAFGERIKMYKGIGVPIDTTEDTKVIFDKSVGANTSEQFSEEQLQSLAQSIGLRISICERVGDIAYICKLNNIL